MATDQTYKTKQRQIILDYLSNLHENHITASQIYSHFRDLDIPIGITTVYRQLEKFVCDGIVRKYYIDGIPCACFQYIEKHTDCCTHIHFKCTRCGKLTCVECDKIDALASHFSKEHGFKVDAVKTVFYGICTECLKQTDMEQK